MHNNLGVLFAQKENFGDAVLEFKEVLRLRPENVQGQANLVKALNALSAKCLENGQIDQAKAILELVLEINPNSAAAHCNLGVVYAQKEDATKALAQFQNALKVDCNFVGAHVNFGMFCVRSGKLNEAAIHFQQALLLDPNDSIVQDCLEKIQKNQPIQPILQACI